MSNLPPNDHIHDVICPVCNRLIAPHESTGRSGSRVLHLACWLTEREEARRASAATNREPARDLLIIAAWQTGLYDLIRRWGIRAPNVDIRLDERRIERRRPPTVPMGDERRRHERRESDLVDHLRRFGWAVVSAAERV